MRISQKISLLSLVTMFLAGCSSPSPTPPAQPAQQAQSAPVVESPKPAPEAPAAVSRPAPTPKARKAPAIASEPVETSKVAAPPKEVAANVPPVADTPAFPAPSPAPAPVVAPPPPPPPQPTTRQVTIPSGTMVSVRMGDAVDSENARVGQTFRATLDVPLAVDRETVAPKGSDVYLRLTHVESAGNLTGRSEVTVELDRIVIGGKSYTVASNTFDKQAASQTADTAKKTGIGAAIGAAVGAIAGGGKGAAIGAGVGGGAGVAIGAATKGQQARIEPESRVDFHLEQPLEVTLDSRPSSSPPDRDSSSGPRLLNGRQSSSASSNADQDRLNLSGKWRLSMDSPQGRRTLDMTLKESNGRLDGTLFDRGRGQALRGNIRGDSISFSTDSGMRFEGRVVNDLLRGTVTSQGESDVRSGRPGTRPGRSSDETFSWTADRND